MTIPCIRPNNQVLLLPAIFLLAKGSRSLLSASPAVTSRICGDGLALAVGPWMAALGLSVVWFASTSVCAARLELPFYATFDLSVLMFALTLLSAQYRVTACGWTRSRGSLVGSIDGADSVWNSCSREFHNCMALTALSHSQSSSSGVFPKLILVQGNEQKISSSTARRSAWTQGGQGSGDCRIPARLARSCPDYSGRKRVFLVDQGSKHGTFVMASAFSGRNSNPRPP